MRYRSAHMRAFTSALTPRMLVTTSRNNVRCALLHSERLFTGSVKLRHALCFFQRNMSRNTEDKNDTEPHERMQ